MGFAEYIHGQFSGFLKAGKKLQPPQDASDKAMSRFVSFLLIAVLVALVLVVWNFGYLSWRIGARFAIIILPLIGFIIAFYRGISVRWMVKGLLKYWLPTSVLILTFYVAFSLFAGVITNSTTDLEIGMKGGILMCIMGFLFSIAYWHEARHGKNSGNKTREIAVKIGSYFMALVWVAFFIGGIVMILWATGIGDMIFN
jgi:hypothetical protein